MNMNKIILTIFLLGFIGLSQIGCNTPISLKKTQLKLNNSKKKVSILFKLYDLKQKEINNLKKVLNEVLDKDSSDNKLLVKSKKTGEVYIFKKNQNGKYIIQGIDWEDKKEDILEDIPYENFWTENERKILFY